MYWAQQRGRAIASSGSCAWQAGAVPNFVLPLESDLFDLFLHVLRLIQAGMNLIISQCSSWLLLVQEHQKPHSQACNKVSGCSTASLPLVEKGV